MSLTALPLPDAEVLLSPDFLSATEATVLLTALIDGVAWRQESIRLFGKEVPQPRLTAWHGDAGAHYTYSGLTWIPQPWTPVLQALRNQVENACDTHFNSVLLNLYRTGQDSMGWHADNEPELGTEPVIASLSLGAPRRFRLKPRDALRTPHDPVSVELGSGSLLVMRGSTQEHWLHAVPKTAQLVGPRLNLTFRQIISA